MNKRPKLWSVTRIRHPDYPGYTVRVGEFESGGVLHLFRQVHGKQRSRSLGVRRVDLDGDTPKQKIAAAEKLGRDFIKELVAAAAQKPAAPASPTLTLTKLIEQYELRGFEGKTPGYKRDALAALRRVAAALGPDKAVAVLLPSDIEGYMAQRRTGKKKLRAAPRADVVALKIACRWAWRNRLLTPNPFAQPEFDGILPKKSTPRQPYVTEERYEAMQNVAAQFPPLFGVLLTLAWETGHRLSAILELQWSDVSFDKTRQAPNGTIPWYPGADTNKRFEHTLPMTRCL